MIRMTVIAVLIAAAVMWWRFGENLSWTDEVRVGGLPCVMRASQEYESYMEVAHPGWCGLTIRYVPAENPPAVAFVVSTVPDGERVVSGTFAMRRAEATARFKALWLPPRTPIRIRVSLEEGDEDLLPVCQEVVQTGRRTERVLVETHHRYGRSVVENLMNWFATRVAPFVLPGFEGTFLLFVLLVPVGAGLLVLAILRRRNEDHRT